jgi:hypothetical protein
MACGTGIGHRVDDEDCRSMVGGASAAEAWELRANRFGEIGQWTNMVDSSELVGDRVDVGARNVTAECPVGAAVTASRSSA